MLTVSSGAGDWPSAKRSPYFLPSWAQVNAIESEILSASVLTISWLETGFFALALEGVTNSWLFVCSLLLERWCLLACSALLPRLLMQLSSFWQGVGILLLSGWLERLWAAPWVASWLGWVLYF